MFLVSVLAVFAHTVQVECANVLAVSWLPAWCIYLSGHQRHGFDSLYSRRVVLSKSQGLATKQSTNH
jgi:hypothetical protein